MSLPFFRKENYMSKELNLNPDKDEKKKLRKLYVILITFALAFFISGMFYGRAYAATTTEQDEAISIYKSSGIVSFGYTTMYTRTDGSFILYNTKNPMTRNSDGTLLRNGEYEMYRYNTTDKIWTFILGGNLVGQTENITISAVFYTSYNLLNYDGTIFFSIPKLLVLPPRLQQNQLQQVLQQVVGLLPILMVCLVGFLGLRKGLAVLQQKLHQA